MADQSAIRIPQGQLPINLVDSNMRLYCSPTGSDSSGDGSISNPYFHPSRALADLKRMFFTETGHATIEMLEGVYNYNYPIIVNNTKKKSISLQGAMGRSFVLQEVTDYKYDAIEEVGTNGYGVGSLVDQRITVKLAESDSLFPEPTSPVTPSVTDISVGDYVLFRDETNAANNYDAQGKDGSVGGEGLTGPFNGDARTNVLGCYEIIAVNASNNTVQFRSRGKNFLHKIGKSFVTDNGDIEVNDDIFAGGYRTFEGAENGDPTGKYGTLQTSGIDTATGTIASDHKISAKIVKSILRFTRPSSIGRAKATKGLVLKPNSSLTSINDLVFQGDVRYKHFNEMDPASSNGEGILAFKNSSIGSEESSNVGLSGWYAGVAAHTNSNITLNRIAVSDCSFGIVAETNSSITSNNSTITGCDVVGVLANNNSNVTIENTVVGSAGYSPLTIDLENVGSDAATLQTGQFLTLQIGESGRAVTSKCVWNSYANPYDRMRDPVEDLYNYYPINTKNQIYVRGVWPVPGDVVEFRDESTNEVPPHNIITAGGFAYGVGSGVLPEASTTSSYTPDEACGSANEDRAGGVCFPPGFFGDAFDFTTTQDGGFFNFFTDLGCVSCTVEQCNEGTCVNGCPGSCCRFDDYACDNGDECDPPSDGCPGDDDDGTIPPVDCSPCDSCDADACDPCRDPGQGSEDYCSWCEQCGNPGECFCFCNAADLCCTDPTDCSCQDDPPACCGVECTLPVNCGESPCCCDAGTIGADGRPCFCSNLSCGSDVGTPCPGLPGVFKECASCPDGECPCPGGTDNAGTCIRPCNNVEPPDQTIYRIVDHPLGIAVVANNNSLVNADRTFVTLTRNGGFVAMENSVIDANRGFVRACAGPGYFARENSSINARNSVAQRTRGGFTARQNSNVQAQASYARDNAEFNFIALNDSIVNIENATSVISRVISSGDAVSSTTTVPVIYSGLSNAHGQVRFGSFINKTGVSLREPGTTVPNNADDFEVDSSSHIEPNTANAD